MLKPEQVPNEAIREAMQKFLWHMNEEETPVGEAWSIIIAAAINAWPGVYANGLQKGWKHYTPALILPLPPQENPDAASK